MLSGIFCNDIQFFRFYRDGVFLDCLIKGGEGGLIDRQQIQAWFCKEELKKGILQGNYSHKGEIVTFMTPGHFGNGYSIDYEGRYKNDCLILNSLDHNTGHKIKDKIFVRLI